MTETTARPELGDLKPGQKVMVRRSPNDMRHRPDSDWYIPAVVVKAARVWVDLSRSDLSGNQLGHRTWRMRRDTQDEATQYSGSNDSFATLDQHEWDETQHWARGVLEDNGIRIDHSSPWRGRQVELADLITKGGRS
jgi:hypothetical protein